MNGMPIMKHTNRSGAIATRNTLVCTIPGIRNPVEIAFQSRKLPVCKKCKKIYKTRDLCRVRDCHTDLPWNTTYICFLVNDSCLVNNRNWKQSFMQQQEQQSSSSSYAADQDDGYYVAETIDVPSANDMLKLHNVEEAYHLHQLKKFHISSDKLGPNPPICHDCKDKNYTRNYCRIHHSHTHLPWNTTYAWLKKKGDMNINASADLPTSTGFNTTDYSNTGATATPVGYYPDNIPMDFIPLDHQSSCNSITLDMRNAATKRQWGVVEEFEDGNQSSLKKSKRTETTVTGGGHYGKPVAVKKNVSSQSASSDVNPNSTVGGYNDLMAFLLVIHEGNLSLHMLEKEKQYTQCGDTSECTTSLPHREQTPISNNHSTQISNDHSTQSYSYTKNEYENTNISSRNQEESFDNDCFPPLNSYDSRDPPESSFSKVSGYYQRSSPPFSGGGHLLEPIPYNPNSISDYHEYGPTHNVQQHHHRQHHHHHDQQYDHHHLQQHHHHHLQQHHHYHHTNNSFLNIYDGAQEEHFNSRRSSRHHPASSRDISALRYSSSHQPYYYSRPHGEESEPNIDLYDECREPPSPSYHNQIFIEPVDDYHCYCYNNNHDET